MLVYVLCMSALASVCKIYWRSDHTMVLSVSSTQRSKMKSNYYNDERYGWYCIWTYHSLCFSLVPLYLYPLFIFASLSFFWLGRSFRWAYHTIYSLTAEPWSQRCLLNALNPQGYTKHETPMEQQQQKDEGKEMLCSVAIFLVAYDFTIYSTFSN